VGITTTNLVKFWRNYPCKETLLEPQAANRKTTDKELEHSLSATKETLSANYKAPKGFTPESKSPQ